MKSIKKFWGDLSEQTKDSISTILTFLITGFIVLSVVYFPSTIYAMDQLTRSGFTKGTFLLLLVIFYFVMMIPFYIACTQPDGLEKLKNIFTATCLTVFVIAFFYFSYKIIFDREVVVIFIETSKNMN